MRRLKGLTVAAAVLTSVMATPAFADSRHRDETSLSDRAYDGNRDRGYRDNERVTMEGRITNLSRERDGYRVQLDRNAASFWLPERSLRNRRNDFRLGVSIRLGGVFRSGVVNVDVVDWPGAGGYYGGSYNSGDRYDDVRGTIERVDYRRGVIVLHESATNRFVTVDMVRTGGRIGLDDLRRGDYVEISGNFGRGVFQAYRVESVRQGRY